MKMNGKIVTNSTIFILPMFGLPKKEYDAAGFASSFIRYGNYRYGKPVLFAVFYARERYAEKLDDIITMIDSAVLELIPYNEALCILVLEIPKKFQWDYDHILHSNYSKVSEDYRQIVSDRTETRNQLYNEQVGKRLPLLIVEKDELIKQFIQKEYDIILDLETEVWERFDIEKETLTEQKLRDIMYQVFRVPRDINKNRGDSL